MKNNTIDAKCTFINSLTMKELTTRKYLQYKDIKSLV